jgi:phage FluMu protein Com
MASLLFNCPRTNQRASTCIETDVQSLRASWRATLRVNCPHCGEVHEISVCETYINGVLDPAERLHCAAHWAAP